MPLNFIDGDFLPFIKYNAKTGRLSARLNGAEEWTDLVNINIVFDMEHIKTGWILFDAEGPHSLWSDSVKSPMPPRPAPEYKQGFQVLVYNKTIKLCTWSSSSWLVRKAIKQMYDEFENGLVKNPGKYPIFVFEGATEVEGEFGTNYSPKFKLIGWADGGKVPAITAHHESKVEVLPPTNATSATGNGQFKQVGTPELRHVMQQKSNYVSSSVEPAPADDSGLDDNEPIPF